MRSGGKAMGATRETTLEEDWSALRARLEERRRELHEAVRAYPSPIARCDDQLPKLIAQRDAALQACRLVAELEPLIEALGR
jgi:hypothetical protein